MTAEDKARARAIALHLMGAPEGWGIYTFHQEGMFYPIPLRDDADAIANAKCNPGTLKVVNELTGATVWPVN